jgi:hypothetical protein
MIKVMVRSRLFIFALPDYVLSFIRLPQYIPNMSISRVVGVVLLIAGIVLIIMGVVASHSLADSLSAVFRGRLTQNTMWYIFGGIALAVVGLLLTLGVIGRTKS